jgi:hypothetical protein
VILTGKVYEVNISRKTHMIANDNKKQETLLMDKTEMFRIMEDVQND